MTDTGHLSPSQLLDPFSDGLSSGVNNIFQAYLGTPTTHTTNPGEKRNVTIWNLAEAYEGRSAFIKDTIEDWLWTADQTYYTEVILPWKISDDIHVEWATWEANAHMLGYAPTQTASREISQRRTVRRASLVRRGLSMSFEHDFVKTAIGRTSYLIGLGQIARSIQETANAEVIRALLHAHQFQQQYVRDNMIVRKREHIEWLTEDRDVFATCQKDVNGLRNWHEGNKETMHEYQGQADTLLLPSRMLQYVTSIRPENWIYGIKGPRGPGAIDDKLENGATAREITPVKLQDHLEPQDILADLNVYQARAFHVDGQAPLDLLARVRQIGEYNTMFDTHCDYSSGYTSKERGIMMYNEDQDKMDILSLHRALMECGLFDMDGNLRPLKSMGDNAGERDARDAREDFLSMTDPNGEIVSVDIFGDIDPVHYGRTMLNNLGKTVVDQIFRNDPQRRNRLVQGLEEARSVVENADGTVNVTYATTGVEGFESDFKYLSNKLRAIFGANNLFLTGDNAVIELFNSFVAFGQAPVLQNQAVNSSMNPSNPKAKKIVDATFKSIRVGAVTPQDEQEIDDIVQDGSQSVDSRIESLRELFMSWVDRDANPLGANINSAQKVNVWFNNIYGLYTQYVNAQLGGKVAERNDLSWAAPHRVDVEYAFPEVVGQMVPMGYEQFPSSINQIPMFTQAKIALHLRQQQQGQQRTSAQQGQSSYSDYDGGLYGVGSGMDDYGEQQSQSGANADGLVVPMPAGLQSIGFLAGVDQRFGSFNTHINNLANGSADFLTKICAAAFLGARVTRQSFEAIINHNVLFPMNFLLLRPHATYRTRIAIKVQARGGAGRTYYGHSDAQIAHDINIKIGKVHFTCWMAAIVDAPKNVFVQPDMYVDRYLGGLGTKFWDEELYNSMQAEDTDASIICVALPYTDNDIPNPMDIAGRFYTDNEHGLVDEQRYEPLHYSTAYRYNNVMYNFFNRINAMDEFDMPSLDPEQAHINRICWRGHQAFLNKHTGKYDLIDTNTGHWGPDVAQGRRRVADGKQVYLRPQNYSSNGMAITVM